MTFVLINMWNINVWQQTLLNKITEHQPAKVQSEKVLQKIAQTKLALANQESNEKLNKKSEQAHHDQEKPLVFAQIDLPQLPKPPMDLIGQNSNNAKPMVKKTRRQAPREQQAPPAKQPVKPETKQSVSATYQQLILDSSINIELAWPNKASARQDLFAFLYQCVGMKFGVLNNQNVTLAKIPSPHVNAIKKHQPSDWLRIAQGQLANQERHWLQQYNLSGTPVRLFPKEIDWQLAKLINHQLNGQPLTSLRAHYQHQNQRLILTNIRLNGQWLNKNWILIENKCSLV